MTNHRLLAFLFTLATVITVALRAGHAADISVFIPGSYVVGWIDDAIDDYLSSGASSFEWHSSVKHLKTSTYGVGSTTLHVELHLSYEATIPVHIDFDLFLDCGEGGPSLLLDNLAIKSLVPVPDSVRNTIKTKANEMLAAKTENIVEPVWSKLDSLGHIADVHKVCPHFEVYSNGSIYTEVDFEAGCINDHTKHNACTAKTYWGDGYDYVCDNGYWKMVAGWCERKPPPGGQIP